MTQPIELIKPIPAQIVNEGASFGPLKLTDYMKAETGPITFSAEVVGGVPLPKGLICTSDGLISGIPAKGTEGVHTVSVLAETEGGGELSVTFHLTIQSRIEIAGHALLTQLKSEVWQAIGSNSPPPDVLELLNRPISAVEMYYLLERFATLTIWDVYNFDSPGERKLLILEGASPHYDIYDRGSCLVGSPKELFSHERTLADTLQTARIMIQEVYKRGWVIEMVGFDKMRRAAWVEAQHLAEKHGKRLEILRYSPSSEDMKIVAEQNKANDFGLY